jgi:hypothetical protein
MIGISPAFCFQGRFESVRAARQGATSMKDNGKSKSTPALGGDSKGGSCPDDPSSTTTGASASTGDLNSLLKLLVEINASLDGRTNRESWRIAMTESQSKVLEFVAVLSAVLENNWSDKLLSSIAAIARNQAPVAVLKQIGNVLEQQFKYSLHSLAEALELGEPTEPHVQPLLNCMLRLMAAVELAEARHQKPVLKRKSGVGPKSRRA